MNNKNKLLKQQSHHLAPVVLLGNKGLTPSVHAEIAAALAAHELIKIKLCSKEKSTKEALAAEICVHHEAELVNQIGHVITIYKKTQD